MPRAKAPPRVKGPYSERGGSRFRIRVCDPTGHRDLYFATLHEAQAGFKQATRELAQSSQSRKLGNILDECTNDRVQRGLCGAQSARDEQLRLRRWLAGSLQEDISKMTAKRAAGYYEQLIVTPTRKTGRPPTAATHRFYLSLAKRLFRWVVRKGYLRESPFTKIQPGGRPNRGKKQLRFEEAERFITTNAARNPEVPEVLRPRLIQRAAGRRPEEYLFGMTPSDRPKARQVLHAAVRRVCLAAGVPVVCPHSLRGLWATAGVRSGALSHAVAAALGHGSFKVTAKHYVRPGTLDGARTEQLVKLLDLRVDEPEQDPERRHAEQLLSSLPVETLAQLLELAGRSPESNGLTPPFRLAAARCSMPVADPRGAARAGTERRSLTASTTHER